MKTLTNDEIIYILENVCNCTECRNLCCPLADECLYYFTGEKCGSALEEED